MPENESDEKRRLDGAIISGFFVCGAALGIIFFGGANAWTAVSICGLSVMGLGIAFLVLKKH